MIDSTGRVSRRALLRASLALAVLPLAAACQQAAPAPAPTTAPAQPTEPPKPAAAADTKPAEAAKPTEVAKPAEAAKPATQAAPAAPKGLTKASFAFATRTINALAMNLVIGQELGY